MTVWKSLQTPKFGVVVYNFSGSGAHRLRLQLGETVQILEESPDWFRGHSSKNKTVKGIFPKSFIHVKEIKSHVSSGQVTGFSEDHLVEEVTDVLREWGLMWKHLYLRKEDNLFQMVKKLMLDLMDWRRQILAQTLPVDQVKQLKSKITSTIDYGNRILGLDLVVRDDSGNIIDPDSTGVIELYRRHMSTSNRIQSSREEVPRKETTTYTTHSVYVNIKNVVCNVHDDAEVFIGLYDAKESQFISEQYLVFWDKGGMPKDIDRLYYLSVLFTDLGSKDLKKDKMHIVCQIVRIGRMDLKDPDSKKLTHNLRRPFGIAVFPVGDMMSGEVQYEDDKELFLQLHTIDNQFFDTVIKRVTLTPQENRDAKGSGQGIWISARLLAGNVDQIREEHPLIVTRHTSVARKLGFPEVIMPGDVRNDLYVTILSGEFEKGGKRASKNIEVTMHVCSEDGTILENVISLGAGEDLVSEYRSFIFYHSGKPEWMETIKLVIPIEQFYLSHLRFTFKHRSGGEERDRTQKVFAFTYANLMHKDGTTLADGSHDLVVYKSDGKKPNPNEYLKFPSDRNYLCTMAASKDMPSNDKFQIRTLLCSTKLTQNVDLLGLLKWRSMPGKLKEILVTVMKVSGEEIVKFLTDTFDALFAILMEHSSKYDKLVFDALVFTISLLADKKYHQFRPVLDAYIEGLFGATKAHVTLIAVLRGCYIMNALRDAKDVSKIEIDLLLKAMKAMEYIFKFIVQSRVLFERAVGDRGKSEFEDDLRGLFHALVELMKDTKNETLLIQGAALKYFPATFSDLLKVFDARELGHFAREFIEKIPEQRLTSQKMDCVHNMVKSKLFEDPNSRQVLLPMVVAQLSRVMEKREEMKTCIDVLNDILTTLTRDNVGDTHEDILLLATSLLRVVVKGVILYDRSDKVMGNYVACLTAMLQLMEEDHYRKYVAHFKTSSDLLDFLMEIFLLFREFVGQNVYPSDWMVMTMVQNSVILNTMQYFSDALHETFLGDHFEYQVWNNFFHLAVAFVTQDSLQLESFTIAKQDKILEKYSDMRMIIGLKIYEMWQTLVAHKRDFIPGLVGNFLEMTLIPHEELRRATIPIFFDMIEVEYASQKSFRKVEAEIISKLDVLVEGGRGDEEYKRLFHKILYDLFSRHPVLTEEGIRFVELVTKLMERLLDYRTVISGDDNIDNRMSCTVNVLNFYREIGREEMYGRYVYKLCDLHLNVESYTEAAFTLLRRADDLKWSDDPMYSRQGKYEASTHRQLKEMLYKDIIDYFDKGKCWEYAIKLCKTLAEQYEYGTFDFIQLSQILMKQAKFYDNIIKVVRGEPEYFRVGFFGLAFPSFLRNKLFVYRGKEYEKLGDFTIRIQSQYPSAEVLKYVTPPPEEIKRSTRQYLQINKVDPSPVERRKFQGKNVMEQITQFYEVNNVNKFQFSRPFHKGPKDKGSEFKTMWLERTTMYTKFAFPGILCWFEVSNVDVDEVSPIQHALETMESANKGLRSLIGRHKTDTNLSISPLSMKLNGILDASVMGGISNYEKLFLTPEFVQENAQYQNHVDRLKELIVEQVNILEQGVALHESRVSDELRPFHENLKKCFMEMKSKTAPYRRQQSRISTTPVPRTSLHRETIVRREERRVTHRDSFEDLHQSYTDLNLNPSQSPPPVLPIKRHQTMSSPSGRPSRLTRGANAEARMTYTEGELSPIIQAEIPPAKPPRPQNGTDQAAPPVPQKSNQRYSDQRSSTGSSGSEPGPGLETMPTGSPALPPRVQTKSCDSPPVPPKTR